MDRNACLMMVQPDHFSVSYAINPWMRPAAWAESPEAHRREAIAAWTALKDQLHAAGARVVTMPATEGLPDLVFAANSAIVLDGRALLARFRYPERRGEQEHYRRFFDQLVARGLLDEVGLLPETVFQEGAGDCIWDEHRQIFWSGFGPRSARESVDYIRHYFGQQVVALPLATADFYHLDTCFFPLPGGEVLYCPKAFSDEALVEIGRRVPAHLQIPATFEEASSFCLNGVALGRELIMATPPPRLQRILEMRGYTVRPVDLSHFMLSGGAAYCMTLRLDRASRSLQHARAS